MTLRVSIPQESPVLCLDTCSVLDLVRDPMRRGVGVVTEHAASLALLDIAEVGSGLEVRVAGPVCTEYAELIERLQEEATRALENLERDIRKVDGLNALHGSKGRVILDHWVGLQERRRQAADRWMQVAEPVPPPSDVGQRVYARMILGRPPSRPGGGGLNDCTILETYLAHVREVREDSDRIVVFVSSDTNDFANANKLDVADEIREEFDELDLKYAPNMRTARRLLGLS